VNSLSCSLSLQRAARSRCPVFAKQSILIPAASPPPRPQPHPPSQNGWCNRTLPTRSVPRERNGVRTRAHDLLPCKLAALPYHFGHNLLFMLSKFQLSCHTPLSQPPKQLRAAALGGSRHMHASSLKSVNFSFPFHFIQIFKRFLPKQAKNTLAPV